MLGLTSSVFFKVGIIIRCSFQSSEGRLKSILIAGLRPAGALHKLNF
jgi:hypothetical protein